MSAIYECECDSFEMYEEQDPFEMAEAVPGLGVPSGGLTGQVLKKRSDEDFDTEWADESGGGGGTSDYTHLSNKPQINGNTLAGNKTGTDLGLVDAVTGKQLSTEDYTTAEKTKLSGIEAQANKTVIDDTLTNTGEAADAKAVGDKITQLESDVQDLQDIAGDGALDSDFTATDLTGAANELKDDVSEVRNTLNHKADVIYDTASGPIASFPDGADGLPVKDLTVGIEPVQDLHGYANPWPAGGNVNLLDPNEMTIKGTIQVQFYNANNFTFKANTTYLLRYYGTNKVTLYYAKPDSGFYAKITGKDLQFTPEEDCQGFLQFSNTNGIETDISKFSLSIGSSSPASWTPYSNICPISGRTGANVYQTGSKNVLSIDALANAGSGTLDGYSFKHVLSIQLEPNTEYTLSTSYSGASAVLYFDGASSSDYVNSTTPRTKTTDSTGLIKIGLYDRTGIDQFESKTVTVQLEKGASATPYVPFVANNIFPISWQSSAGTVYDGTLNALTGKLKTRPYYASYNGETLVGPWISSMDVYTPGGTPTTGAQVVDLGGAETEYTIDPVTITTLLGENNIWSDTGSSTVEYSADTKLYIDKKLAALVAALS